MKHKNKEINVLKTIFMSFWNYSIAIFLFGSAMIYAGSKMEGNIGQICFYAVILLIMIIEFSKVFPQLTFYSYKDTKPKREEK